MVKYHIYYNSSFAIKISGTTYELLMGIFYSGKSQHNFTKEIRWISLEGSFLKRLNVYWNDPETCAKALFDDKMAENMGKHPKAVQNPSKYDEFLASRSGSHPKWLQKWKYQVSYLIILSKQPSKIVFRVLLTFQSSSYFFLKLNCGFPKKSKK